jgi:hypothetical protein
MPIRPDTFAHAGRDGQRPAHFDGLGATYGMNLNFSLA